MTAHAVLATTRMSDAEGGPFVAGGNVDFRAAVDHVERGTCEAN